MTAARPRPSGAAAALLALALLAAGCLDPPEAPPAGDPEGPPAPPADPPRFGPPVVAMPSCGVASTCFEPTVAVGPAGRAYATDASGNLVAAPAGDGFLALPGPQAPTVPPSPPEGDAILETDAQGRLWYASMVSLEGARDVHLARSSDGGLRWELNRMLGLRQHIDRPWLAVDGERVWVVFNAGDGLAALRSEDGGATFTAPALVAAGTNVGGRPVVGPGGDLLYPMLRGADRAVAVLRVGADGSVRSHDVASGTGATYFPSLALGPDGRLLLAWRTHGGQGGWSWSADGGASWAAPRPWGPAAGVVASPWAWAGPHGDGILYLEESGGAVRLQAIRRDGGAWSGPATLDGAVSPAGGQGNTDFAHGALAPSGRLVATWTDGDRVLLAWEAP